MDLFHEEAGTGTPVLLIAGLGTDSTCWALQVPDLQQVARVITVDNPGVGRSSGLPTPTTCEAMADALAPLLDQPGVVVGHSLGGAVAQQMALRHPDRVSALVLAATGARLDPFTMDVLRSWRDQHEAGLSREAFVRGFLPWIFSRRFFENPEAATEARRLYVENPWPQTAQSFANQVQACGFDTRALLNEIRVPTVVITGAEDLIAPPALGRELAWGIRGSRFVELPAAGHACMAEAAEAFNREVRTLL